MNNAELIEYALSFFQEFIKGVDYIKNDNPENLEHNLNNLKNKAIRSYDFIKYHKNN